MAQGIEHEHKRVLQLGLQLEFAGGVGLSAHASPFHTDADPGQRLVSAFFAHFATDGNEFGLSKGGPSAD